jgi:hypothetical protein
MSVRAYRVNKIDMAEGCTFNLWHNQGLMDFFISYGIYNSLNSDGCGMTELPVEVLESAIEGIKSETIETESKEEAEDLIKSLQADIDWAKANNTEFVQYECF